MRRGRASAAVARAGRWLVVTLLAAGLLPAGHVHGNGIRQRADEPPTAFERFILAGCSPCVKEVHAVATMPAPPLRIGAFGRAAVGPTTRPGEIAVDVVRAYPLGRPSRQQLALRVTLLVSAGVAGEVYRIATGLLDEAEVGALVDAVGEMARVMSTAPAAGGENTDIGFHGGSLRVGVVRVRGETIAYVQGGDVERLALNPVWEVPTTLFLAPAHLPVLANMMGQGAARIRELRAAQ